MASRIMLERWAASLDERRGLESFIEWLREHDITILDAHECAPDFSDLLDEYHEIDRGQLEVERRALLAAEQESPTPSAALSWDQPAPDIAVHNPTDEFRDVTLTIVGTGPIKATDPELRAYDLRPTPNSAAETSGSVPRTPDNPNNNDERNDR